MNPNNIFFSFLIITYILQFIQIAKNKEIRNEMKQIENYYFVLFIHSIKKINFRLSRFFYEILL